MKISVKGLFVILSIVMSLFVVQSVCAETVTGSVTGVIQSISTDPNMIVVLDEETDSETEVYGVKFDYLCNHYKTCIVTGDTVTIDYYEFYCRKDDTFKNMASSITVGDLTVVLREVP